MKYFYHKVLIVLIPVLLTACGGEGDNDTSSQLKSTLVLKTYNLKQGVEKTINYIKPSGFSSHTFKVISPSHKKLEVKVTNKDIQELSVFYNGLATSVTLIYQLISNTTKSLIEIGEIKFNVLQKAPLYIEQWALNNTGQKAFSDIPGIAGEDINVEKAHRLGYLGKGVRVAVVDTVAQIGHEDLMANAVINGSYDFVTSQQTPTVKSSKTHGTAVAGIIVMKGWNAKGGIGVAPEAEWVSYNYLDKQSGDTILASSGYSQESSYAYKNIHSERVDVFNFSFGNEAPKRTVSYGAVKYKIVDILRCGTTGNAKGDYVNQQTRGYFSSCNALREGKGANYIKSMGNRFSPLRSKDYCIGLSPSLSCKTVSGSEIRTANPFMINVGALNAKGLKSSYSSTGPAVWISAPGGEFGFSNEVFKDYNIRYNRVASWDQTKFKSLREPAIISTDLMGCLIGMDKERKRSDYFDFTRTTFDGIPKFDKNISMPVEEHPLNKGCNYTSRMNGTSAAAPMVSGVVALMLGVNTDLTWRDVKYILAKTAKLIDSNKPAHRITLGDGNTYVQQEAWRTNGAGYRFHNWYGFGAVDAGTAVAMASTYTDFLTNATFRESTWSNGGVTRPKIKDNSIQGAQATVIVPTTVGISTIEGVQIRITVSFATGAIANELNIRLTSPQGMVSNLLHAKSSVRSLASDSLFYSNAFYGESPVGQWQLEVIDSVAGTTESNLTDFKLRLFGEKSR